MKKFIELLKEIEEAERTYKKACEAFNELTVDGIQDINTREGIRYENII